MTEVASLEALTIGVFVLMECVILGGSLSFFIYDSSGIREEYNKIRDREARNARLAGRKEDGADGH